MLQERVEARLGFGDCSWAGGGRDGAVQDLDELRVGFGDCSCVGPGLEAVRCRWGG